MRRLIVNVRASALTASSGTNKYGFENIVGVGISEKVIDHRLTGEPCVVVYVVSKEPVDAVLPSARVPETVNGVPTDVVATGEVIAFPYRGRYRPAPGGVSIGHYNITAGTLGCLAKKGQVIHILSNNHVMADVNNASIGDPILQPGPFDGGTVASDVIAKLTAFTSINFAGGMNDVDCAIAETSQQLATPLSKCLGKISSTPVSCSMDMLVRKCGRTTQLTRGRITDCNATIRVGYGTAGIAVFENQIVVQSLTNAPFSQGGDSGSLIVTDAGSNPVGLLFAGSASHTIANKIKTVLTTFGVTIVS